MSKESDLYIPIIIILLILLLLIFIVLIILQLTNWPRPRLDLQAIHNPSPPDVELVQEPKSFERTSVKRKVRFLPSLSSLSKQPRLGKTRSTSITNNELDDAIPGPSTRSQERMREHRPTRSKVAPKLSISAPIPIPAHPLVNEAAAAPIGSEGYESSAHALTTVAPTSRADEDETKSDVRIQEELVEDIDDYVRDTGLEAFFSNDHPFVQFVAAKASELRNDPTTDLGKSENRKRLAILSLYQPVLYCDDSMSMDGGLFSQQREIVKLATGVATKALPDGYGVLLTFINSTTTNSFLTPDTVEAAYDGVTPSSGSSLGTNLRKKILDPMVYDVFNNEDGVLQRPLLIITITDGVPTDESESTFKDEIMQCRQFVMSKGYNANAVRHCICQIGGDVYSAAFLEDLGRDQEIQDVIYVTTDRLDSGFEDMRGNWKKLEVWLLNVLTDPIMYWASQ